MDRTPVRPLCHLLLTGLLVVAPAGCGGEESAETDVAVTISGEQVPYADFEKYLESQLGDAPQELGDAALSSLFDQFLDGELLARLAVERGLVEGPVDPRRAVAFLLQNARFEPSAWEMQAYFEAHPEDFEHAEQVRLRVILVQEPEVAREALAALAEEDFAAVAARFSQGPTAHLGGDQGWLSREDLPSAYGDVIFDLEVGEISEIVKADFGYQIFQVTAKEEEAAGSFEEAQPQIHERLESRFMDEQLGSLLEEARGRYNVRVLGGNLPFDYRGAYQGAPA